MAKALYIAEKPSVAREFAKALKLDLKNHDGYMESGEAIVTWCVGHLVTMSYPEAYDEKYKKWSLSTLPFLPENFKYEVIPGVKKQYKTVAGLLNRPDVGTIYVCTDSGREGEYIYRLVERQAKVRGKDRRRVWIDSQTEDEILRGIREAKDLSEYDNLCESAYLRAKEDYLMGINFSRLLTLKYGDAIARFLKTKYAVVSVGRVMTCVQGMVVRREREIREFTKTPFYRAVNALNIHGNPVEGEWRAVEGSAYFQSPKLYKENGFKERKDAEKLISDLISGTKTVITETEGGKKGIGARVVKTEGPPGPLSPEDAAGLAKATVFSIEKKKENKYPPLLYNLAELQNDCSKFFKISPDQTLQVVQELYEKKLVTYPRTDARVLSSAVAKEIYKNISGMKNIPSVQQFAEEILEKGSHKNIAKTRYTNDKQITDHYAIIPTGQGISAIRSLNGTAINVYEAIVRRFLSIFFPPAVYRKINLTTAMELPGGGKEKFFSSFKVLESPGYRKVMGYSFQKKKTGSRPGEEEGNRDTGVAGETSCDTNFMAILSSLKKGMELPVQSMAVKEGETSPPKRYNSGSIILAMENAGQLIEDEELRAQIKGSGIGTSATRAEILKKLVNNKYLALNKKTQAITPTLLGEMVYDVVNASIRSLLNPDLTASWEKGLTYVAEGSITPREYMDKLEHFIQSRTSGVLGLKNQCALREYFQYASSYYKD
ncbi:MAG: type IA DNA topoisomerase [Lachnospiraceae bacterium]|jgi:DNA topoisomerase-3|nr:type IA DNA topoisomerase [Lachnospiraceae bacterium]MCI8882990.1 type IA DNA topoisomerase [Lachnospiraceae bacterium]